MGFSCNGFQPVVAITDVRHFHAQSRLNEIVDAVTNTPNTPVFKLTALESRIASLDVDTYTHLALQLEHAMLLGGVTEAIIVVYEDFATSEDAVFARLRAAQPGLAQMKFHLRRHNERRKGLQTGRTIVVRCMDTRGSVRGQPTVAERVQEHLRLPEIPYVFAQAGGSGISDAYELEISLRHLVQMAKKIEPQLIVLTTHERCARMFGAQKDAIPMCEQHRQLDAASLAYRRELEARLHHAGLRCPIREFLHETDSQLMHGLDEILRFDEAMAHAIAA